MKMNFLILSATRKDESLINEIPLYDSFNRINVPQWVKCDLKFVFNNTDGLSKVYNTILNNKELISKYDFVLFIHDDIYINDVYIFDKLKECAKFADVFGVCGGKGWKLLNDGKSPIPWTYASMDSGMSGFMLHTDNNESSPIKRHYWSTQYGKSPFKVLTLDGCFICFTKTAIEKDLKFDEQFKFHYYDMDVCFNAYLKKLNVMTVPILLTHNSFGASMNTPEYMDAQQKFIVKYFKK